MIIFADARCHESNPGFSVRVHFIISWRHFCAVEWNNRRTNRQSPASKVGTWQPPPIHLWPTKNWVRDSVTNKKQPQTIHLWPKSPPCDQKNTSSGILESYLQHYLTKNPQTQVLHFSTYMGFLSPQTQKISSWMFQYGWNLATYKISEVWSLEFYGTNN